MKREKSEKEREKERERGGWVLLHLLDCPPGDWQAPCPRRGGSHRPPPRRCPCSRGSAARSGESRGRAGIPAHTKGSPVQKRTQRRGKRIPTSIQGVTADASKLISISRLSDSLTSCFQGVVRCGGEVIVADTLKLGCGLPEGNLPSV